MTTLYAVIWEDRHTDVTVHLFAEEDAAVVWAGGKATEMARDWPLKEQLRGSEDNDDWFANSGWVYHVEYGDACTLRVVRAEVVS